MSGFSTRLCSSALRLLVNACKLGEGSRWFSSEACNARLSERLHRAPGVSDSYIAANCGESAEIRSRSQGLIGVGTERSNLQFKYSNLLSPANIRVGYVCVDPRTSSSFTRGDLFLRRNFAASASYGAVRRPKTSVDKSRFKFEGKTRFESEGGARNKFEAKGGFKSEGKGRFRTGGKTGGGFLLKDRNSDGQVRSKHFSGALSSIKGLESEDSKENSRSRFGKPRSKRTQRSPRKRIVSSVRFARNSGQTIGVKGGAKPRLSRKLKSEERPEDDDERTKRRRKRIRPRPRDVTFKRGLNFSDSSGVGVAIPAPEPEVVAEKALSTSAKFRQIDPSRELLRQIEENLLGRRRLVEWRRAGFDPKRTAPLDDLPESKDRRAPIQETAFKQKLTFIAAAKIASSLPPAQYTEIAFAGRSNVGKSSLINALTRQWGVARTSDKPGLTQSINFFTLGSQLCLVDLPGYGFAFAKSHIKEEWEELVKEYVTTRSSLKRVCLLVDAKWGLKPRDVELLELMESSRTRYQIILTKTDVLPPLDLARRATQVLQILKDHKCLVQPLMMVSSKSGAGLPIFRASLARVVSGQARLVQDPNL